MPSARDYARKKLAALANGRTLITVEEAGTFLDLPRSTAYNVAKAGGFPVIRLGRYLRVPVAALERLVCGES